MRRISISPPVAALLLAVVLFLLSGLLPNGFGSDMDVARAQATNILRLAVFLGVIAAGQTLVIISGSEGIDLSAGSIVTSTFRWRRRREGATWASRSGSGATHARRTSSPTSSPMRWSTARVGDIRCQRGR